MLRWSVTYPLSSWASLLEAVYQYKVLIHSPVTKNLLFLNQWKREKISMKECVGCVVQSWNSLHTKRTCYRPTYRAWSCHSFTLSILMLFVACRSNSNEYLKHRFLWKKQKYPMIIIINIYMYVPYLLFCIECKNLGPIDGPV